MTVRVDKGIDCFRNESVSDININKEGIYVVCNIEGIQTAILVDTGASVSILSSNFVEKSNMTDKLEMKPCSVFLTTANGERVSVQGECHVEISFGDIKVKQNVLVANIQNECIMG